MCLFTKGAHATLFCLDVSHSANTLQEIYMTNLDMFSHMKAGLVLIIINVTSILTKLIVPIK